MNIGPTPTIQGCAVPPDGASFNVYANYVICNIGNPDWGLYTVVMSFGTIVGFILIMVGCYRLTKHGKQQQMFRYHSPLATTFYLGSGAALVSYTGFFQMLSATFFQTYMDPNPLAPYYNNPDILTNTNTALQYLTYSCLIIVGVIALVRGMVALIKLGEGQGNSDLTSSVTYLLAGTCALNAQTLLGFFGIWTTATGTG